MFENKKMLDHYVNEFNLPEVMTITQAKQFIDSIGYEIDKDDTFIYFNQGIKTKAFYIVEKDTKLGFANINARKDENFRKLLAFRCWTEVKGDNIVYQF